MFGFLPILWEQVIKPGKGVESVAFPSARKTDLPESPHGLISGRAEDIAGSVQR